MGLEFLLWFGIKLEKLEVKKDRGCFKGSILYPNLLTIYLGKLQSKIGPDIGVVTYKDLFWSLTKMYKTSNKKTELVISKIINYLRSLDPL